MRFAPGSAPSTALSHRAVTDQDVSAYVNAKITLLNAPANDRPCVSVLPDLGWVAGAIILASPRALGSRNVSPERGVDNRP